LQKLKNCMYLEANKLLNLLLAVLIVFGVACCKSHAPIEISYSVFPDKQNHTISQLIYGTNHRMYMSGNENLDFYRIGGNRLSAYNWENSWSNAGSDWKHSSDNYLIPKYSGKMSPALTFTSFLDNDVPDNAKALVTVQMAGYVSADGNGRVGSAEAAPSPRWVPLYPKKNKPFTLNPDLNDKAVYIDELVNFLVTRYGPASEGGVFAYSLDNEPGLWSHTHSLIRPDKLGAQELVELSVQTATAIKDIDPAAKIFGPSLYGYGAFNNLAGAPDWPGYQNDYAWFIDFYLAQMNRASKKYGRPLLDVLDLHWYSEAVGRHRVTKRKAKTREDQIARLQGTRTLWDQGYVENSWIARSFASELPLIPTVKESIEKNFPGTKLAFTEYSYGGDNHISGGVAQADVLGIFGKYDIYAANIWLLEENANFISAAFRLYRNYDGKNSSFGDISIDSNTSDKESSAIYSSIDSKSGRLHMVVLNKSLDAGIESNFNIESSKTYSSGQIFAFSKSSKEIKSLGDFQIKNNRFDYSIPPLSALHFVLKN